MKQSYYFTISFKKNDYEKTPVIDNKNNFQVEKIMWETCGNAKGKKNVYKYAKNLMCTLYMSSRPEAICKHCSE